MAYLEIRPAKLAGKITAPPSKSMAHRAVICAALAGGESTIRGVDYSDDILATMGAVRALGAEITPVGDTLTVQGIGGRAPRQGTALVDCNESGSTLRFCIPIFAALGCPAHYVGRGNLGKRPLAPYYGIFDAQGMPYRKREDTLDLWVEGKLAPAVFSLPGDVSSQFISGLLFALPLLGEGAAVRVTGELESRQYLDLTLAAMADFGVEVRNREHREFTLGERCAYTPCGYTVEGDYSQSAFFAVANALGSSVEVGNLRADSLQGDKAALDILARMGAGQGRLRATEIDASGCPDVIPVLALAAALAQGTTRIVRAGRLRIKECDRLSATAQELNALGANIEEGPDSMTITGVEKLRGGCVWSHNDHRMAMMLAIAATCCEEPVLLKDPECVSKSYGHFFRDYEKLGGIIHEQQHRTNP